MIADDERPSGMIAPSTLIIVCCHAIFHGDDPSNEDHWVLQSFQRSKGQKPGEHLTFLNHIEAGLTLLSERCAENTFLIFSGGRTNPQDYPSLSEARSYLDAGCLLYGTEFKAQLQRVLLEEDSTDSFQNLLFSILRFHRETGFYPSEIIIVTHKFKEARFLKEHAEALRWPPNKISVTGLDPVFGNDVEKHATSEAEQRCRRQWQLDPYGHSMSLRAKRFERGWHDATWTRLMNNVDEEVVRDLIFWKGGVSATELFPQKLPWSY